MRDGVGTERGAVPVALLSVLGVVALLALVLVSSYNRLVRLDQGVQGAWSQVENQLQRRFDLIPNLVETVKGYAKHEKDLFTAVTEARSRWSAAGSVADKARTAGEVESALSRLLLLVEAYPQLQASQNFRELHYSLEGSENRIATERMRYNDAVLAYNTAIRTFPSVLLARLFSFGDAQFFRAPEKSKEAPKVAF